MFGLKRGGILVVEGLALSVIGLLWLGIRRFQAGFSNPGGGETIVAFNVGEFFVGVTKLLFSCWNR